jgi:hypothetical protein
MDFRGDLLFNFLAAGGLLLASLAGPMQAPAVPFSADKITIDVVSANGSGCPADTAVVDVSPDGTAFTVTYSQYTAQVGVGAEPTDFRKNCQLGLNVHIPQGYTFAITEADYRGFSDLAPGAIGYETANYYFQGNQQTTRIQHKLTASGERYWQTKDTVGIAARVYRKCGELRNLNINTELRVSAGKSNPKKTTSFVTMDSTDGNINTVYHLAWKKC